MPFPLTTFPHRSVGPTLVTWNATELGYADDRIQIEERPFYEDIRNDAFGGAAGMPSDVHFLGAIAMVSCNLNRFDITQIKLLGDFDAGFAHGDGMVPDIGKFLLQDSLAGALILSNAIESLTYSHSFLRQGRRFNVSTRHQIFSLVFECHVDDPCDMKLFAVGAAVDPCASS